MRGRCIIAQVSRLPAMKLIRIPLVLFLSDYLRGILARPHHGGKAEAAVTDPDFDGWVANDPMVTMDPASRYGDDATGFLSGREDDDPKPVE